MLFRKAEALHVRSNEAAGELSELADGPRPLAAATEIDTTAHTAYCSMDVVGSTMVPVDDAACRH